MALPTKKSQPVIDPWLLTILIYGKSGIGKSTFCSRANDILMLPTEPGLNAIAGYKWEDELGNPKVIESWEELWQAYVMIQKGLGSLPYKAVCIDTVNNAHKLCASYICRKNNVQHETDIPGNSKGFTLINNEFYRLMKAFASLPLGLFMTAHEREATVKTRTQEWTKAVPDLPDKSRGHLIALSDYVLFCTTEEFEDEKDENKIKTRRVIKTRPHQLYDAKDRFSALPDTIPLAYKDFLEEFKKGIVARGITTNDLTGKLAGNVTGQAPGQAKADQTKQDQTKPEQNGKASEKPKSEKAA